MRELTPLDAEYPERLRNIPNPPRTLYVRGTLPPDSMPTVAIIGARSASDYGLQVARSFGRALAMQGVGIVSGMAAGIDSAGQWGAVDAEAKTYAVFGCGLNVCYPARNYLLYDKILQYGGGAISELPLDAPPLGSQFASRNRIIAGLADAILVLEARERSGTFITVGDALDQGKQIFALPGRVTDGLSKGCNQLIRQGAELLASPEDVLEYLHLTHHKEQCMLEKDCSMLNKKQKKVYDALEVEAVHLDQLIGKLSMSVQELSEILIELEILGFSDSPKLGFYRRRL
ncbi:MAG TPA: DNA-protecting protein DprA [Oribacterium sp.]|nr:DNA-protecting protein DprA [Oribacterium sp.]